MAQATDIPVPRAELALRIELGRRWMSVEDLAGLSPGSVIELRSDADGEVDVYAAGRLAARGELVVVDGNLGVRVAALMTDQPS